MPYSTWGALGSPARLHPTRRPLHLLQPPPLTQPLPSYSPASHLSIVQPAMVITAYFLTRDILEVHLRTSDHLGSGVKHNNPGLPVGSTARRMQLEHLPASWAMQGPFQDGVATGRSGCCWEKLATGGERTVQTTSRPSLSLAILVFSAVSSRTVFCAARFSCMRTSSATSRGAVARAACTHAPLSAGS